MLTWLFPLIAPSIVKTVEARRGSAGRWRWYGLDRTGGCVVQCAGNYMNTQGALAAGRAAFPRAKQRIRESTGGLQ